MVEAIGEVMIVNPLLMAASTEDWVVYKDEEGHGLSTDILRSHWSTKNDNGF